MHECPECAQACGCDLDDTWMDTESENCIHQCDPADLADESAGDLYDEEPYVDAG